jgi:hypothetical protein
MDLRDEILKGHSKKQTAKIAGFIGNNKDLFKELMSLFLANEYRVTQRAAWIVRICTQAHPELIKPYIKKMISNLRQPVHDAVKRNTLAVFQDVDFSSSMLGELADTCFTIFGNRNEAIAIRCCAMTVLGNICKKEPLLKNELKAMIVEELPYAGPAFRARAKKVLKIF